MVKKRAGSDGGKGGGGHDNNNSNHHHNNNDANGHGNGNGKKGRNSSSSKSSWLPTDYLSPSTLLNASGVVLILSLGPFYLLFNLGSKDETSTSSKSLSSSSSSNGGWRLADEELARRWDSNLCNIERVSVEELSAERFEREYRFKRPVLVTFPHGAKDWTDPQRWTQPELIR